MPFEIAAMPALIERPETMTLFDEAHARAAQAYHRSFGTLYPAHAARLSGRAGRSAGA